MPIDIILKRYIMINLQEFENIEKQWDWSDRGASGYAGSMTRWQVAILEEIIKLTNVKSMLEIGFNCGFSSWAWLKGGVSYMQSVDIAGSLNGVKYLKDNFGDKFNFLRKDSRLLEYSDFNRDFDLVFIDGDHTFQGVNNDIAKSLLFNPKFILLDDYVQSGHRNDIRAAVGNYLDKLEFVKEYNANPGFGLFKVK